MYVAFLWTTVCALRMLLSLFPSSCVCHYFVLCLVCFFLQCCHRVPLCVRSLFVDDGMCSHNADCLCFPPHASVAVLSCALSLSVCNAVSVSPSLCLSDSYVRLMSICFCLLCSQRSCDEARLRLSQIMAQSFFAIEPLREKDALIMMGLACQTQKPPPPTGTIKYRSSEHSKFACGHVPLCNMP